MALQPAITDLEQLKERPELARLLAWNAGAISGAKFDRNELRFEVVYQLFSIPNKRYLRLKVKLSGDDAAVDSLVTLWPGANFFEREVFDLFGIRFDEHPNLTRIMMPENWEGH